jgi:ribosome-binding factor A
MATEHRRSDRVAEAIREEVATFLAEDAKDPRITGLVTVTSPMMRGSLTSLARKVATSSRIAAATRSERW